MAYDDSPIRISRLLFQRVKAARKPQYKIADEARITPPVLSALLHGSTRIRENDERVLAVARVLGVPEHRAFARGK